MRLSKNRKMVLASRSPQRRAILEELGVEFDVVHPSVDELCEGEPSAVVVENALRKARAVERADRLVLGVDTEVYLDGQIFGKANDEAQARAYLSALNGRTHQVFSGIALIDRFGERTAVARTAVIFRKLEPEIVDWYLQTGEWRGRAGAYAIQGRGAALVAGIEGDYWNVVGLPVGRLLDFEPSLTST